MKNITKIFAVFLVMVMVTGCYHAKVSTDAEPSNTVIENKWAPSFVFGLVPPPEVETANQCPNGVAMVESKISFLNGLVSSITFSLFTPMHIKVTCADAQSANLENNSTDRLLVEKDAEDEEITAVFSEAANKSAISGKSVAVQFE